MGNFDIIARDTDEAFATPELSDYCIEAANRTAKLFDPAYPGWQLYSRIVRGDTVFDRQLAAWAIGMARLLSRTHKVNGQAVVAPRGRRNDWIAQAGIDALEFAIAGKYSESANEVAKRVGVWHTKYQRIRGEVAVAILDGLDNYRAELHHQLHRVLRESRAAA